MNTKVLFNTNTSVVSSSRSIFFNFNYSFACLVLFVLTISCSFSIVYIHALNKRMYAEMQTIQVRERLLDEEYYKLLSSRMKIVSDMNVRDIAVNKLNMEVPKSSVIVYTQSH